MSIDAKPLKDYLSDITSNGKKEINEKDKLFSTGLIDSFGMLDLLFFINENYGVNLEHYDISDNNVDTVEELLKLIEEKK